MIDLRYLTIPSEIPDFIYLDLKKYAKKSNIYHPQPNDLVNKIAKKYGLKPQNIFLTAGSDEAIFAIKQTYKRLIIYFTPTYSEYSHKLSDKEKYLEINSYENMKYFIKPKKFPNGSLLFIANPNNPFGLTSLDQIYQLIELNPTSLVVIDEAYSSFTNLSVIKDTSRYPNLIVLRSFSKDYGLAGIRLGYLVANDEIISEIKNNIQITNTSYLSIGAAISAMDHQSYFTKQILDIKETKEKCCKLLTKLSFHCINSDINALLIKFNSESEATNFYVYLQNKGIYINIGNSTSNLGLDNTYARIALGSDDDMHYVMKVLKGYKNAILH